MITDCQTINTSNVYYKLANDIKISNKWDGIGNAEDPFCGNFDGDFYTDYQSI